MPMNSLVNLGKVGSSLIGCIIKILKPSQTLRSISQSHFDVLNRDLAKIGSLHEL